MQFFLNWGHSICPRWNSLGLSTSIELYWSQFLHKVDIINLIISFETYNILLFLCASFTKRFVIIREQPENNYISPCSSIFIINWVYLYLTYSTNTYICNFLPLNCCIFFRLMLLYYINNAYLLSKLTFLEFLIASFVLLCSLNASCTRKMKVANSQVDLRTLCCI